MLQRHGMTMQSPWRSLAVGSRARCVWKRSHASHRAQNGTPKMLTEAMLSFNLSPGWTMLMILALIFLLGWPLEWVPIVLIIVPIMLPVVEQLDFGLERNDLLIWFAILVAVCLQTAWLSPPVALSAYFLKGVVPEWDLKDIYLGMMQFMCIQLLGLALVFIFPTIATWLPTVMYGGN